MSASVITPGASEAAAAEAATVFVDTKRSLGMTDGADWNAFGSGRAVVGGEYAGPNIGRAWGCGRDAGDSEETLSAIESFFVRRNHASRVALAPDAQPAFQRALAERSYRFEGLQAALWCPLQSNMGAERSPPGPHPQVPMRIRRARIDEVMQIARGAFGPKVPIETHEAIASVFLSPPYRSFTAWMGDQPVGIGAFVVVEPFAFLLGGGTIPAARNHGVQRRLLLHRLEACRELGLLGALVHVAPGSVSERNLARVGFRTLYHHVLLRRSASG